MKKKIKPESSKNERYIQLELQFAPDMTKEELKKQKKRERNKKYYQNHREQKAAYNAKYRAEHPEYQVKWKAEHPEYQVKWKAEHPDYFKEYHQDHREEQAVYHVKWRIEHKEQKAAYDANWRANNPEYYTKWQAEHPEYYKEKRAEHPEYYKERQAKYNKTPKGRAYYLANAYKQIDKNRSFDITDNISANYILKYIFTQPCYYCGNPHWREMGADRIDNSKGHVPDNVLPCCLKCNIVRNDRMSVAEMKAFVEEQKRLYPNDFKFEA